MTVVILDFKNKGECLIDLISGGGAVGLARLTTDAEKKSNKQVKEILNKICLPGSWNLILRDHN